MSKCENIQVNAVTTAPSEIPATPRGSAEALATPSVQSVHAEQPTLPLLHPLEAACEHLMAMVRAVESNEPGKLYDLVQPLQDALRAADDANAARIAKETCDNIIDLHVPKLLQDDLRDRFHSACSIPERTTPILSRVHRLQGAAPATQDIELKAIIDDLIAADEDKRGDEFIVVTASGKKVFPSLFSQVKSEIDRIRPLGLNSAALVSLVKNKRDKMYQEAGGRYLKMCNGEAGDEITLEELLASLRWITAHGKGKGKRSPEEAVDDVFTAERRAIVNPVILLKARKVPDIPEETLATASLGWTVRHGGKFYRSEAGGAYLFIDKKVMALSGEDPTFGAWFAQNSGLSPVTFNAKVVTAHFRSHAQTFGTRIKTPASSYAIGDSVYLHPQLDRDDRILRIRPGKIEFVDNGTDNVILIPCEEIRPFNLVENTAVLAKAPKMLRRLFLDRLPCSPPERALALCYTLATLLRDHAKVHPLLHIDGKTNEGKSSAAAMLTILLYGAEMLVIPTTAASYSMAARLPLLVLDNKEGNTISEGDKLFLLAVATRAGRTKRVIGTASAVQHENPNCMVVLTAIEPQGLPEIRNRFFRITATRKHWCHPEGSSEGVRLPQSIILNDLLEARDLVLSWLLRVLADRILPDFGARFQKMVVKIQGYVPKNGCVRGDEYLALCGLWLEALATEPELGLNSDEVLSTWVVEQAETSEADQAEDSQCVMAMEAILQDLKNLESKAARRGIEAINEQHQVLTETHKIIGFTATLRQFVLAATDLVKNFPYSQPVQLKYRLNNEREAAKRAGWLIETVNTPSGKAKHTVKGNVYLFKKLVTSCMATTPEDFIPAEAKNSGASSENIDPSTDPTLLGGL